MQDQRAHIYFAPQNTGKPNTSTLLHIRMRLQKYAVYRRRTPGAVGIYIYMYIYTYIYTFIHIYIYNPSSLVILVNQSSHGI